MKEPYEIENSSLKGFEIDVYLNDKRLPHSVFNAEQVIPASGFNFAEFDLFTCSCGVPGCAGFHYQVIQNKTDKSVVWTFPETDDYKTEKKVYEFEIKDFAREFEDLLKGVLDLEAQGVYYSTTMNSNSIEEQDEPVNTIESITKSIKWYKESFQVTQSQHDILLKEFPEMFSQKFIFIYDGTKGKHEFTLKNMIGKILNEYPYKISAPYIAKCKQAAKAIDEALQGENDLFYKLAKTGYSKSGLDVHAMVEWSFDNLKEEGFDLNKLSIQKYQE